MSTLSVRDLQGLGTFSNTVRVPSGHTLDIDGKFILPTYTSASNLPASGNTAGELSFVSETGQIYVWTGVSWVAVGGGLLGYSSANPASSPQAILNINPSATNGAYWYNFGSGSAQIYTDFSSGGYLLAAKINSSTDPAGPWTYSGSNWSSTSEVNASQGADITAGSCVTKAYYEYNMTTGFRMGLGSIGNVLTETYSGGPARGAFVGSQRSSQNGRSNFHSWFNTGTGTSSSIFDNQPYCNTSGFNVTSVSSAAMRWGITMNNENDCASNDSAIGFGTYTNGNSSTGVRNVQAGGHRWNPDERYPAQGYIFVK